MAIITKTLKTAGGDYSVPATWESTEQTNLVTDGDSHVLECYTGTYAAPLTVIGWTTDATHTITIQAATGNEHGGVSVNDGGTGVALEVTTSGAALWLGVPYASVIGIELIGFDNSGAFAFGNAASTACGDVKKCIMSAQNLTSGNYLWRNFYAAQDLGDVVNNIFISSLRGLSFNSATSATLSTIVANNTIISTDYPVFGDSAVTLKNNAIYSTTTRTVTGSASSDYNASNCTMVNGANNVTGLSITDGVDFIEPSTGDYRPEPGGALDGAGVDLSSDFTDDIAGTLR